MCYVVSGLLPRRPETDSVTEDCEETAEEVVVIGYQDTNKLSNPDSAQVFKRFQRLDVHSATADGCEAPFTCIHAAYELRRRSGERIRPTIRPIIGL